MIDLHQSVIASFFRFMLVEVADAQVEIPDIWKELLVELLLDDGDGACCRHLYGAVSFMPNLSVLHMEHTGIPHCLLSLAISNDQI